MNQTIMLKQLAFRYFEGSITKEEGVRLFDFVRADESHVQQLRQWEKEWLAEHMPSNETKAEWHRLTRRLKLRTGVAFGLTRSVIWSVAASIVAVVCIAYATYVTFHEVFFVCQAPMGGRTNIVLPDGSQVILNAGSSLRYSNLFDNHNRKVELSGEAFFDVARMNGSPFTVHTAGYDVVVQGTRFNVSAYPDDNFVATKLFGGRVEVQRGDTAVEMQAGQMVVYDKQSQRLAKFHIAMDNRGWVDHRLNAEDMSLQRLTKILSRQYDVNIHITDTRLQTVAVTMHLNHVDNIDDIMLALGKVIPANIHRKGKHIVIKPLY